MRPIFELSNEAVELFADASPIAATYMGVAGRDARWPDLSPAGHASEAAMWADIRDRAEATATPTDDEVLAKRVLVAEATEAIQRYEAGDHLRDLNNVASTLQSLKDCFEHMDRTDLDGWARTIIRLETIHMPFAGYRESLAMGIEAGTPLARRQIESAIEESGIAAGPESGLRTLVAELAATDIGDDGLRGRLDAAVGHACTVFADFAEWLETSYLPHSTDRDGVGRERYVHEARKHLGMDIDIDETYAWGWAEVARITQRMETLAAEIEPGASATDVVAKLMEDPSHAAATVEEFIDTMQQVQDAAMTALADVHFDVPEQIRSIDVKVAPPGGALAPYYSQPSEDFSRAGTVWYPIGSRTSFPLWEEMTTAYHEGFPGHHLQVGVQLALGDRLSRFHRVVVWQPGAGEGWALYAERLMGELGFHDQPQYELGMLAAELMRACRVVVDIGLHCELPIPHEAAFHPGEDWTWELAVEMLHHVAHQPHEMAESEVTRYLGWPGQAISYKIGQQVYLDLRDELRQRPGFDLKAFHSRVLGYGSIGLDLLKELTLAA